MRIHRLRLSEVKGVQDREVSFPDRGVIVLEGPNEVGKTTLLEALDVLLEEKDSSRKRHVMALRPVGRDVPTAIEAELSSGPYRFRYRKQWFRQPATELHVLTPRVEQFTGVAAHDRVAEIIAETTDVPLWRALRLMQAAPLGQVELGGSAALSAALDAAAQALLADGAAADADGSPAEDDDGAARSHAREGAPPRRGNHDRAQGEGADGHDPRVGGDSLVAAAEIEVARYFTTGRGQPTGEYRAALEAADAAQAAEDAAAAGVAEVEADVARHEELAAQGRVVAASLQAARAVAADWAGQWQEVTALQEQHALAGREADAAGRELGRARERLDDRAHLIGEIEHRARAVVEHERAVADLAVTRGPDEGALAELVAERAAVLARFEAATARVRSAELAEQVARAAETVAALTDRLERGEQTDHGRRDAAAELARHEIDERAVCRIDRATTAVDLALAQRDADSAQLSLAGLTDGATVLVDGVSVELAEGEEYHRSIAEQLEIVLPGRLRLRLHPESGAAERGAAVETARRELAEALAAAGVTDAARARERLTARRALEDRLARATDRLDDILSGTSLDRLRDDLAAARARHDRDLAALRSATGHEIAGSGGGITEEAEPTDLDAAGAAGTGDPTGRPCADGGSLDLVAVRAAADATAETLAGLTARVEASQQAVTEVRLAQVRAESLLAAAHRELAATRDRLAQLRDTETDDALAETVSAAEAADAAARGRLAAAGTALADLDPDQIRLCRDGAVAALQTATERVASLRDQRLAIEARLEQSGRQGRYEALEDARGAAEHADRKLAAVRRRAEAARLLHDTLQAHRAAAKRRYVAPFADAIRRLGRVVYGPGLDVEVAENLAVEARVLDGDRIGYEALSTGAKEQLAILIRLAVATLVDPRDGVPVVIDDALGYSDPARLRRMTAAFSMVGAEAQVILLTCTPGRYDGIVGAEVIRLGDEMSAPGREVSRLGDDSATQTRGAQRGSIRAGVNQPVIRVAG